MAHALAGFDADAGVDHFIVLPQRPVEQDKGRAPQAAHQVRRHLGAARNIEEVFAAFG